MVNRVPSSKKAKIRSKSTKSTNFCIRRNGPGAVLVKDEIAYPLTVDRLNKLMDETAVRVTPANIRTVGLSRAQVSSIARQLSRLEKCSLVSVSPVKPDKVVFASNNNPLQEFEIRIEKGKKKCFSD